MRAKYDWFWNIPVSSATSLAAHMTASEFFGLVNRLDRQSFFMHLVQRQARTLPRRSTTIASLTVLWQCRKKSIGSSLCVCTRSEALSKKTFRTGGGCCYCLPFLGKESSGFLPWSVTASIRRATNSSTMTLISRKKEPPVA